MPFCKKIFERGENEIEELVPKVMDLLEKGDEKDPRIFERKIILDFAKKYYPPRFSELPRWAIELPDHAKIVIEGEGIDFFRYCLKPKETMMYDKLFEEFKSKLIKFEDFEVLMEGIDFIDNLILTHTGFHDLEDFTDDFDIHGFIEYKLRITQKLVDRHESEKAKEILKSKVIEAFEYRSSRMNINVNRLLTNIMEYLNGLIERSTGQYSTEFIKILNEILEKYN